MENLAHRKRIVLNDLVPASIYSSQQTFLSYLIDGYTAPSRCTTIDSTRCRNNEPHIIIDLNRNYHVHGVVIHQLDSCTNEKCFSLFYVRNILEFSFTFISR